ncbi:MAG TPA: hypothetical protein VM934_05655 [Pyrinomonadaceae bacterium]|jgi:hypothetical protein|nr:hypothetical protein [Pyrinomonadaceae bacterium]
MLRTALRNSIICVVVLLSMCPVDSLSQATRRRVYIDRGACEGEACSYGLWKTMKPTILYARPDERSKRVARLEPGGPCVNALTGDVHVVPGRLLVTKAHEGYKPGDVLGVYTYLGEDVYKVRHKGRWREESLSYSTPEGTDRQSCERNRYCWGVFEERPDAVWWVKIRAADGRVGWTNECTHFEQPYWLSAGDCPTPSKQASGRPRRTP